MSFNTSFQVEIFSIKDLKSEDLSNALIKKLDPKHPVDEKIIEWVKSQEFMQNPVNFLYKWKISLPKDLSRRLRPYSSSEETNQDLIRMAAFHESNKPVSDLALIKLTNLIMDQPNYVSSFTEWLKNNHRTILQKIHSKTDADVLSKIMDAFSEFINQPDFENDLTQFKDHLTKKDKIPEKLKFVVLYQELNTGKAPKNIIRHTVKRDISEIITNFFDFAHSIF